MKEKDIELKQLIKEAVLEALMEFTNQSVAVMNNPEVPEPDTEGDGNSTPEDPGSGNNNGNNGNNGGNGGNGGSGNGTTRPIPMPGMGGFSLR